MAAFSCLQVMVLIYLVSASCVSDDISCFYPGEALLPTNYCSELVLRSLHLTLRLTSALWMELLVLVGISEERVWYLYGYISLVTRSYWRDCNLDLSTIICACSRLQNSEQWS